MSKKNVYYEDLNEEEVSDEDAEVEKSKSDEDVEETTYKKRGPKRKKVKKKVNVSFKLNDSDIDSYSEDESENTLTTTDILDLKREDNHKRSTLNTPWIEKYRPVKVEDLVLDSGTLNKIKKIVEDKTMPNIIITGVPGIGKTTTILCIAKNLLGKYFKEGVLELNASDERGVKTVQQSIEYFCKKKLDIDKEYSHHKIILLDEADNMTKKAQQAINNLMEQCHETTRFAFTCNNSTEIIEAIQSRCIIFRYSRINNEQIIERLKKICNIENIPFTDEGLNAIVTTAQGDLRQAINNLQLTFNGYNHIIPENVYRLCDKPHPLIIQNIFIACNKKDIKTALNYLNELSKGGYSSSDISMSMLHTLKNINNNIMDEKTKIKYMEEISKACLIISKGLNTPLQLTGCIAALCKK
jgi:replication factor C subunit 2/4